MPTTTPGAPSDRAPLASGVRWKRPRRRPTRRPRRRHRPWWFSSDGRRLGRWLAAAAASLAMLHSGCVLRRRLGRWLAAAALHAPPACMCSLRRPASPQVRVSACRVRGCCARGGTSRPQRTGGVCEASWRRRRRMTLRRRARRGRDCGAMCSWAPWWARDVWVFEAQPTRSQSSPRSRSQPKAS
jgi:hypothetical protein